MSISLWCRPTLSLATIGLTTNRITRFNSATRNKPRLQNVTTAEPRRPILAMPPMLSAPVPSSWDQRANSRSRGRSIANLQSISTLHRHITTTVASFSKPWHDPSFMKNCSPETVEAWLVSLLHSNRRDGTRSHHVPATMDRNPIDDNHNDVDSTAYLRVLEAYAQSNKLGGAPQKAEYWIGRLERHYARVVQSYIDKYGTDVWDEDGLSGDLAEDGRTSPLAEFVASKSDSSRLSKGTNTNGTGASSPSSSSSSFTTTAFTNPRKTRDKDTSTVQNLQPTVSCYNAVIQAWSNDNDTISVVRSRRWLTKLEQQQHSTSHISPFPKHHPLHYTLEPNAQSYDIYLHSCSRGTGRNPKLHRQRAEEAESILRFRMSPAAPSSVRPTTESFNYVVRAWTRCRTEACVAERVMGWVRTMEGIRRDVWRWETKRHVEQPPPRRENNEEEEEDWEWKRGIAPNTKTYTMAMDAWIVVAGLKADRWYSEQRSLANMYKQLENGRRGITSSPMEHRERFLDRRNGYGDGTDEMEHAASLLQYIQTLEESGQDDVHATVVGYNTLLSGWAKLANPVRPDVPLKSEAILREMMEVYERGNRNAAPDVVSFNAVIKAWGKTKRPNSASRCEWWLRKMIQGSGAANEPHETASIPKPNVQTYNLVMEAWLQLGDAARVQDFLLEMDASDLVSPNSESFSKVIRAWLQEEMNHQQRYGLSGLSCENAWKWLKELLERERMGHLDLGPAPELFSSILKTAARTPSRGENLLILGQETFWAMRESRFGINSLAYEWLLEIALKVLHSPENQTRRQVFVESLIKQCCKDGLLSAKCVSLLKSLEEDGERTAEEEQEGQTGSIFLGDPPFPATWSRNVSGKKPSM